MLFKPKALFFDLDGTLVDKKPEISKENREAIINTNKKIPCFISTGRGFSENLVKITNELNLDYGVAQNGAIIFDKSGNIIRKITLDSQTCQNICKYLAKQKATFIVNSSRVIYSKSLWVKTIHWFKKSYKILPYNKLTNFDDVTKILVFGLSRRKLWKYQADLLENEININVLMTGDNRALEINDIKASKGNANSFICALKNIDPLKTMHFGDSMNDSTVLKYQGALVAMKNSVPELKNIATFIGYNYKNGGVAKTIKKLIE